jgi:mRNA-degrading endonuclease RelE of RelBE toxin-antitoxin system
VAYRIEFSPAARVHLGDLPKHRQGAVADAIRGQLAHEPLRETRNRFPMRPNSLATWELRVNSQRVYYDVQGGLVRIQAIATKRGNKVFIGGQEYDLSE